MSNSKSLFIHNGFEIKNVVNIDNSTFSIVYMVRSGGKLLETARFDTVNHVFIDPPFGILGNENCEKLIKATKKIIRK